MPLHKIVLDETAFEIVEKFGVFGVSDHVAALACAAVGVIAPVDILGVIEVAQHVYVAEVRLRSAPVVEPVCLVIV